MAKLPKPAANIPNPSRTHSRVERRYLTAERRAQMWPEVQAARDSKAIEIAHPDRDSHLQPTARRRIPRDPNDWPTVHLAIALDASILTTGVASPDKEKIRHRVDRLPRHQVVERVRPTSLHLLHAGHGQRQHCNDHCDREKGGQ
jgi:hypothetical protein